MEDVTVNDVKETFGAEVTEPVDVVQNNRVFDGLSGYTPELIDDSDNEITALNGNYIVDIVSLVRRTGIGKNSGKPYDFYSMKLRVNETVSGVEGAGRYLDKMYSLLDSEWATGEENLKKLANDLFTANINIDTSSPDTFDESCAKAEGCNAKVRAYGRKKNGAIVRDDSGWPKHTVKFVHEFKEKGGGAKSVTDIF